MCLDLDLIKKAIGWYSWLVRAVYIQSPQAAYIDVCVRNDLTNPSFRSYFSGIHPISFPDDPQQDCNIIFQPLEKQATPEQLVTLAIVITENRELPGMNLFYLHPNLEWRPSYCPRLFDLPSGDDLQEPEKQL